MGLPQRSLAMLLLLIWLFWLPKLRAQSPAYPTGPARALDALLQDYAYQAFHHPRTGIPYDGAVPSNLTGINISAMRLRSGSLRRLGVKTYKEFAIPVGVVEKPYVKRLVLVYQNLGNWSVVYYPLQGYRYLAPVLGLLAYDASNLLAKNLPELDIRASNQPISINFSDVNLVDRSVARCVWFDLHGSINFSSVLSGNICTAFQQGHFSIVVESTAPAPQPVSPPTPPAGAPSEGPARSHGENNNSTKVWIIVGSVVGGFALLVLLGILAMWLQRYRNRRKMQRMESAAEVGETLNITSVGNTKAPVATVIRTQPTLETEYVP